MLRPIEQIDPSDRDVWLQALRNCEMWLARHADKADPDRWSSAPEAMFRRKCLAELSLTVIVAEVLGWSHASEPHGSLSQVRQHILDRADHRLVDLALRSADRACLLAFPLAYACRAGTLSTLDADRVRALLASSRTWGFERLPFRYLDLAVACQLAGVAPRFPIDAIIALSGLAIPPDPVTAHRDAFYGLTHAVFYAFLLDRHAALQAPEVRRSIAGGIRRCLAAGDVDLGLELIVCARLCGLDEGAGGRALLSSVAREIERTGAIVCRPSQASGPFVTSAPDEADWALPAHTMEVAALALRAVLWSPHPVAPDLPNDTLESDLACGEILLAFSRYDLARAAGLLSSWFSTYSERDPEGLISEATTFLASCKVADDQFGYLADDRRAFELSYPERAFSPEVQEPINAACRAALAGAPIRAASPTSLIRTLQGAYCA